MTLNQYHKLYSALSMAEYTWKQASANGSQKEVKETFEQYMKALRNFEDKSKVLWNDVFSDTLYRAKSNNEFQELLKAYKKEQ